MSTRQKKLVGVVLKSQHIDKTAVVSVSRRYRHPVVGKTCTATKKYLVHDESNELKIGDTVEIGEVRPISKRKSWSLIKVIGHADGVE